VKEGEGKVEVDATFTKEGRREGGKEGGKKGRTKRRKRRTEEKGGRTEGRTDGRTEGRKEGRKEHIRGTWSLRMKEGKCREEKKDGRIVREERNAGISKKGNGDRK
jgi:hypothetical protein